MVKVYIELLFLDNFLVNFVLLYLSGSLLKTRKHWGRLCGAAALGGIYACFMFVYGGVMAIWPLKICVSILMCFAAFYKRGGLKTFIKSVLYFYICTFVAGGAAYLFLNAGGEDYAISGGVIIGGTVLRYVLCGIIAAFAAIALFNRFYGAYKLKKELGYDIKICFLGKETACRAYLDTGNALKEPLSGLPVVIVDREIIRGLLPQKMAEMMFLNTLDPGLMQEEWYPRVRMLPCKGVTINNGTLFGFKPDSIKIVEKGGEKEIRAVIGIANESLNYEGIYNALLGPQALA